MPPRELRPEHALSLKRYAKLRKQRWSGSSPEALHGRRCSLMLQAVLDSLSKLRGGESSLPNRAMAGCFDTRLSPRSFQALVSSRHCAGSSGQSAAQRYSMYMPIWAPKTCQRHAKRCRGAIITMLVRQASNRKVPHQELAASLPSFRASEWYDMTQAVFWQKS